MTATEVSLQPSDEPAPHKGSRRAVGVVVGIVAIVMVVAAALWLIQDDDADDTPLAVEASELPYYLPGTVPAGLTLQSVEDAVGNNSQMSFIYLGDPDRGNPFEKRDALISTRQQTQGTTVAHPESEVVTVRGHDAWLDDEMSGPVKALALQFMENDLEIAVVSHTLDRTALIALAESMVIEGRTISFSKLPSDLQVIARDDRGVTIPYSSPSDGRALVYSDGEGARYTVHIHPASAELLRATKWWPGAATKVRDHDAWRAVYADNDNDASVDLTSYTWLEQPAVMISAGRTNGSDDTLTTLIEALRPVSHDEWNQAKAGARAQRPPSSPVQGVGPATTSGEPEVELASGQLNGVDWRLTTHGTSPICLRLNGLTSYCTSSASSTGGNPTTGFPTGVRPVPNNMGKAVLYAPCVPSVTRVVITLADGSEREGTFIHREVTNGVGHVLFVLDVAPDPNVRLKVVAYNADGTPQTSSTVPLGFPTGPPAAPSTTPPRAPVTTL